MTGLHSLKVEEKGDVKKVLITQERSIYYEQVVQHTLFGLNISYFCTSYRRQGIISWKQKNEFWIIVLSKKGKAPIMKELYNIPCLDWIPFISAPLPDDKTSLPKTKRKKIEYQCCQRKEKQLLRIKYTTYFVKWSTSSFCTSYRWQGFIS